MSRTYRERSGVRRCPPNGARIGDAEENRQGRSSLATPAGNGVLWADHEL